MLPDDANSAALSPAHHWKENEAFTWTLSQLLIHELKTLREREKHNLFYTLQKKKEKEKVTKSQIKPSRVVDPDCMYVYTSSQTISMFRFIFHDTERVSTTST